MPLLSQLPIPQQEILLQAGFKNLKIDINATVTLKNNYRNEYRTNALSFAVARGKIPLVTALLDLGAELSNLDVLDCGDWGPTKKIKGDLLYTAIQSYSPGILQLLFTHPHSKYSMDYNKVKFSVNGEAFKDTTPLYLALKNVPTHFEEVVYLLLQHPKINIRTREDSFGLAPIDFCCSLLISRGECYDRFYLSIIKILLQRGVDINEKDKDGVPPVLALFNPPRNDNFFHRVLPDVLISLICNSHFPVDLTVYKTSPNNYDYISGKKCNQTDNRQYKTPLMLAHFYKNQQAAQAIMTAIGSQALELGFKLKLQGKSIDEIKSIVEAFINAHVYPNRGKSLDSQNEADKLLHKMVCKSLEMILKRILNDLLIKKTLREFNLSNEMIQKLEIAGFNLDRPCNQRLPVMNNQDQQPQHQARSLLAWSAMSGVVDMCSIMKNQVLDLQDGHESLLLATKNGLAIIFNSLLHYVLCLIRNEKNYQEYFEKIMRETLVCGLQNDNPGAVVMLLNLSKVFPEYFEGRGGNLKEISLPLLCSQDLSEKETLLTLFFKSSKDLSDLILKRLSLAIINKIHAERGKVFALKKPEQSNAKTSSVQGMETSEQNSQGKAIVRVGKVALRSAFEACLPNQPLESDVKKLKEFTQPLTFAYQNVLLKMQILNQPYARKSMNNETSRLPLNIQKHIFSFVGSDEVYDDETREGYQKLKEIAFEGHKLINSNRSLLSNKADKEGKTRGRSRQKVGQ